MITLAPASVLIHVPDVAAGLAWYQLAFPQAEVCYLPEFDFTLLCLPGFNLEIVQADDKVSNGKRGTVLYWQTDSLTQALSHFESLGARLYRGPISIESGLRMCQVEDPFQNLIGLRGV